MVNLFCRSSVRTEAFIFSVLVLLKKNSFLPQFANVAVYKQPMLQFVFHFSYSFLTDFLLSSFSTESWSFYLLKAILKPVSQPPLVSGERRLWLRLQRYSSNQKISFLLESPGLHIVEPTLYSDLRSMTTVRADLGRHWRDRLKTQIASAARGSARGTCLITRWYCLNTWLTLSTSLR